MNGRLVRVSPTKLYLVDTDLGHGNAAIALEGIDAEFEEWLRRIDPRVGVERLLWDADSYGLDMELAGTVIRRLSELGVLGECATPRAHRPMRVALVGHISESYEQEFAEWNAVVLAPWRRSNSQWDQTRSWDLVSELAEQVVRIEADLVIYVANSTVLDALDLAFLRKLRDRRIPHLPVGLASSSAHIGPFVDFENLPGATDAKRMTVAGFCCDCWAQAQVQVDPDWASLLAHLVFVREASLAPDMVRLALAEASRWANNWWHGDGQVADLYSAQRVTARRDFEWEFASMGASGTCRH
ncbi:MAG: hypothetical protein WAS05_03380 [Candidatus Nanopelagicales bacterium]